MLKHELRIYIYSKIEMKNRISFAISGTDLSEEIIGDAVVITERNTIIHFDFTSHLVQINLHLTVSDYTV